MRAGRNIPGRTLLVLVPLVLLSLASSSVAESRWAFEFLVGVPFPFPSAMTIRQGEEADLRHHPRFASRPFERPLYYAVRIGKWDGSDGWEVELNHDKLYLANPTGEVEHFAISHGFNRITLNRAMERGDLFRRLGAGVVITHPENTVRGQRLPEEGGILGMGYHLSGPTAMGAVGARIGPREGLFLPLEGMGTASWVRVPVAGGHADFAVGGLHGLVGTGYGW